jgi:hypothetical protein
LFEELKGGAAYAGYVVGRHLRMHPYFDCRLHFANSFAVLAGYLCEFHTEQWVEPCSVPVGCLPHTFLQSIVCRSAADCLKSWRVGLLLQDRQREGTFTFSLLPSEIAFILSIIYNNLVTKKDYFSMSKSSVPLQCTECLLIRVQPNTYIEKTEHFRTALHLVKQRGWLNKGYNTQEVWEIQPSFAGIYCVFSGLCDKPHWQDFPSNRSVIKELVKCKTKQLHLRSFSASSVPTSFRESCCP